MGDVAFGEERGCGALDEGGVGGVDSRARARVKNGSDVVSAVEVGYAEVEEGAKS